MVDVKAGVLILRPIVGGLDSGGLDGVGTFLGDVDGVGGGDLAGQLRAVGQVDGHGDGGLSALIVGCPTGGVVDVAGGSAAHEVIGAVLTACRSRGVHRPALVLGVGGDECAGIQAALAHLHAGGGVVIIHGLNQDAVAGLQDGAALDGSFHAAAGLVQNGGVAGLDGGALVQRQGVVIQTGVLVHHKAEGIGIDGGRLTRAGRISGNLAVSVLQADGLPLLHGGVGRRTAGQDVGVSTHAHVNAVEALDGLTDGVSAIAGTAGVGVGRAIQAVGLQRVIRTRQGHLGVDHVQVHIGSGVGGQNGPLGGAHVGVQHGGGGLGAHQVRCAGSAHDAKDPGGSDHDGLVGGVHIAFVQRAAVGVHRDVVHDDVRTVIREQAEIADTGHLDLRVLDGDLGVAVDRDGRTVAGEVAGNGAVALRGHIDVRMIDGVVGVLDDNGIEAFVGRGDLNAGSAGICDVAVANDQIADGDSRALRRCRRGQAKGHADRQHHGEGLFQSSSLH